VVLAQHLDEGCFRFCGGLQSPDDLTWVGGSASTMVHLHGALCKVV
jgi:hypothetical protein